MDTGRPRVGSVVGAVALRVDEDVDGGYVGVDGPHRGPVGHATACAPIIHGIAPDAEIHGEPEQDGGAHGVSAVTEEEDDVEATCSRPGTPTWSA